MSNHVVPGSLCPVCGYHADMATNAAAVPDKPAPGDVSICLSCGELNEFDADLRLAMPSEALLAEIASDPALRQFMESNRSVIKARGPLKPKGPPS